MTFSPLDRNATSQKESRRMMLFHLKQHVLHWGTPSSIMPVLNFDTLKQRQRAERGAYASAFGLRIHRALSWLHRAELAAQEDHDLAFISLWDRLQCSLCVASRMITLILNAIRSSWPELSCKS